MTKTNHLIDGEVFNVNNSPDNKELISSDNEINEKYRKGEMRIVTEQGRINLDSIVSILDSKQGDKKKYILNPEYQRRKRWDNKRKSLLIESFIMNVPLPPIFLYEIEYAVYEVMDGLQRLTAIHDFYKGSFSLEGLEYWQELNGRKYNELPENVKAGIDRRYLSSIILLEETAKTKQDAEFLKQIVFERLNSGGEKLTPQETRNALYNGVFNRLCIRLAQNDFFRKMWHIPLENDGEELLLANESYREMADVELVLRFFAYRHIQLLTSPIDKFLDSFLKNANSFPDQTLNSLEKLFISTVGVIYCIFGEDAFLFPKINLQYKSPSKTIYDPLMQAFALNSDCFDNFIANKALIKEHIYDDYKTSTKDSARRLFDGRYNNRTDVISRIEYFNNFLQKYTKLI